MQKVKSQTVKDQVKFHCPAFNLDQKPETISSKGFLALEGPFSFSTNPKSALTTLFIGFAALALICLGTTELPLRWLISRPAAVLMESLFAALLGKILWDSLQHIIRSFNASDAIFRTKFYAYSSLGISFIVSLFQGPFVVAIFLSTVLGFVAFHATAKAQTSQKQTSKNTLNSEPLILAFILALGFQVAIPLEFLSVLMWNTFFESNGFLIAPQVILSSILVGSILPLPLSLAAGCYIAFYIFGWAGFGGAILSYTIIMGLTALLTTRSAAKANSEISYRRFAAIKSIEIPLIISATVCFIFFMGRYPTELNWSPQALFLCLLTFALSIRNWHILKLLSLGVIVAATEISLELLSGGILE